MTLLTPTLLASPARHRGQVLKAPPKTQHPEEGGPPTGLGAQTPTT